MSEFVCNICDKSYKHRQSLSVHKKKCKLTVNQYDSDKNDDKRYPNSIQNSIQNVSKSIHQKQEKIETFKCDYCEKEYKYRSGKYKHQKKCKHKNNKELFTKEDMDEKIDELKMEMLKMMNKKYKMHHNTFKKIQRELKTMKKTN